MNDNARLHVNRARQGPVLDHLIVSDREGGYAGDVRSGGNTDLASWNRAADNLERAENCALSDIRRAIQSRWQSARPILASIRSIR